MLDHLDDLEADFRAIYHVSDMLALPACQFVRLAQRLPHYQGAMRATVESEARRRQDTYGTATVVPLAAGAMPSELEGMIDYSAAE
jgi:hypothetical protein